MHEKKPGAWKFVWTNLSCETESNHRISQSCHLLEWFRWQFNEINYHTNLQWMFYHLRYYTSIWKIRMKSIVLCQKNQILLFLLQFVNFSVLWIVILVMHVALELQMFFFVLHQITGVMHVYVVNLTWGSFKLSIIDVSIDWSCSIFFIIEFCLCWFLLFFVVVF